MRSLAIGWILASTGGALAQESIPVLGERLERTFTFSSGPTSDPARVWTWRASRDGVLSVSAASDDLDPWVRVECEDGPPQVDDDGGGGSTAWVGTPIAAGATARIEVFSKRAGESGDVRVELAFAPESETDRAAAWRAEGAALEIEILLDQGRTAEAEALLPAAVADLAPDPEVERSEAVVAACARLARVAERLRHPDSARALWSVVVALREERLPNSHPALQLARVQLGVALHNLADYAAALRVKENVLEVYECVLPADDRLVLRAKGNLGATVYALGEIPRAEQLFTAVVQGFERTAPPDDPDLLTGRMNLAAISSELGKFEEAREVQEQVVASLTRTRPPDDEELQFARTGLATTLYKLGEVHAALELQAAVVAAYERIVPAEHILLLAARTELAVSQATLGNFKEAVPTLRSVLEIQERTLPEESSSLARTRLDLATMLTSQGDLEAARSLEEEAMAVLERTLPPDNPVLLAGRANLASTLGALGDHAAARRLGEETLAALESTLPPDHPYLLTARYNLAAELVSQGDRVRARELLESVVETQAAMLPPEDVQRLLARRDLAGVLASQGELESALALLEEDEAIAAQAFSPEHFLVIAIRENLAGTLWLLGQRERAVDLYEANYDALRQKLAEDHPELQLARRSLAMVRRSLGDLAGARELLERALSAQSELVSADHPRVLSTRRELVRTLFDAQDTEDLPRELLELARGLGACVRGAASAFSPREVEERVITLEPEISTVLALADRVLPKALADRTVFDLLEGVRGVGLLAPGYARRTSGDPVLRELRLAVGRQRMELARASSEGIDPDAVAAARDRKEEAERALVEASARLASPEEISASGVQARLSEDEAAVALWRYDASDPDGSPDEAKAGGAAVLALVLRPGHDVTRIELGPSDEIERAVIEWRASLGLAWTGPGRGVGVGTRPGSPLPRERETSQALRRKVLDPLAPHLAGVRRAYFALDDVLNLVPLEALVEDGKDGQAGEERVGDRLEVVIVPALAAIRASSAPPGATGELLAMGGIDYDTSPDGENDFAPLPATREEVRSLGALFEEAGGSPTRAHVACDRQASRRTLEEIAPRSTWLHLATHGFFSGSELDSGAKRADHRAASLGFGMRTGIAGSTPMLLCGLALAGANRSHGGAERTTGTITAEELAGLDLEQCELAVLSACETNVGVLRPAGQGVASLQKALHAAGARSVITSLWRVPDEATRDLMSDFYRRIWVEKVPAPRALWEAKRRLREAAGPDGRKIYSVRDWAGWVLSESAR